MSLSAQCCHLVQVKHAGRRKSASCPGLAGNGGFTELRLSISDWIKPHCFPRQLWDLWIKDRPKIKVGRQREDIFSHNLAQLGSQEEPPFSPSSPCVWNGIMDSTCFNSSTIIGSSLLLNRKSDIKCSYNEQNSDLMNKSPFKIPAVSILQNIIPHGRVLCLKKLHITTTAHEKEESSVLYLDPHGDHFWLHQASSRKATIRTITTADRQSRMMLPMV